MSRGLYRVLAVGLYKYDDGIGYVRYDNAQLRIHPMMILLYTDEDEDMKALSFVGMSGIMAHSDPSKIHLS